LLYICTYQNDKTFFQMEIPEIKQRLTLATVLKYYGLTPDKNMRLCCPFHADKTPSMQVYYKTHSAYCFSSNCKTHGKSLDVIDFIMHKENLTKAEAIRKAAGLLGGANGAPASNPIPAPPKPAAGRETILQDMFAYFRNAVHNSKPARDYIESRGLDYTRLEIGYNTGQFHHGQRRDEELIQACVGAGLLSPFGTNSRKPGEQAYKAFAKYCICFALKDRGGRVTGLYFRSTGSGGGPAAAARHFYLKDSAGLYPGYPAPGSGKLIIAESVIDTASLLQIEAVAKHCSLLAAYGTNRLNDEMKTAIHEWSLGGDEAKEIIFAFDNDEAGAAAAAKYANELKESLPGVNFSKLELPCKDVNETLIAHQPEIFLHLIENRSFIFSAGSAGLPQAIIEPAEKEKPSRSLNPANQGPGSLNTSNPGKITYAAAAATYCILGGLPKQLDTLKVMLLVENKQGFKAATK
jgi:DNA primase